MLLMYLKSFCYQKTVEINPKLKKIVFSPYMVFGKLFSNFSFTKLRQNDQFQLYEFQLWKESKIKICKLYNVLL